MKWHAPLPFVVLLAHVGLQTVTLDELNAFKAALALEREERVAEDDEIVQVSVSAPAFVCQLELREGGTRG
eukprot:1161177-Pelagomonas_calceolata.AAC.2